MRLANSSLSSASKALREAEASADNAIKEVCVSIKGQHIESFTHELCHIKHVEKVGEEQFDTFYDSVREGIMDYYDIYPERVANRFMKRYYKEILKLYPLPSRQDG